MPREYVLKRRAELQEQTRQRIIDAAIELHQTVGPRATTISEIAERAGVGRVTVYRHFPDEIALGLACSGKYYAQRPFPDFVVWNAIADPTERLRTGLRETYAYHRHTQAMTSHVLADGRDHPLMAPYHDYWRQAGEVLVEPWRARGSRKQLLRAAIAVAVSFDTWRTLAVEQGLSDDKAAYLMMRLTCDRCDLPRQLPIATRSRF